MDTKAWETLKGIEYLYDSQLVTTSQACETHLSCTPTSLPRRANASAYQEQSRSLENHSLQQKDTILFTLVLNSPLA